MPNRSFAQLFDNHESAQIDHVARILADLPTTLAEEFYSVMLADSDARIHLDHSKVESKMAAVFEDWAALVLRDSSSVDADGLLQQHMAIGDVHARIGIPAEQVLHGVQVVKSRCFNAFIDADPSISRDELKKGIAYINELFDTCLSVMNTAYLRRTLKDERDTQTLRFKMASTELSVECERMKTELVKWTRDIIYAADHRSAGAVDDIYSSLFGAWLNHKAPLYFGESVELEYIRTAVAGLDEAARQILASTAADIDCRSTALNQIRQLTTEICWHVDQVVERNQREFESRDPLTSLYGRRFLDSVLQRENRLAVSTGEIYSLLLIDVDHFKAINDSHGHVTGDKVLREVAQVLAAVVRQTDFCFRYGGDEFLVIMPGTKSDAARSKAETLRRAVAESLSIAADGNVVKTTVSIGCASFKGQPDYELLLQQADQAVYAAKAAGKDCVKVAAA